MWDSRAPINKRGFMIWLTFVKVHWDFFVHLSAILEEEWRVEQYCRQNQNGQGNIVQNRGQMGELTKRILCCKSYGVTITRVLKKQRFLMLKPLLARYKFCNSCSGNVEYCVNMPWVPFSTTNCEFFNNDSQSLKNVEFVCYSSNKLQHRSQLVEQQMLSDTDFTRTITFAENFHFINSFNLPTFSLVKEWSTLK